VPSRGSPVHQTNITASAAREASRVALVTCGALNGLDPDDELLLRPLKERGVQAEAAAWDDPAVDWAGYDLAVLRSTWDYATRLGEFLAWARRVPRLANPVAAVEWNTDKRYLRELAAAGVPTTPTTWVEPGGTWEPADDGPLVVKPSVSAGSIDSGRYGPDERELAAAHVRRLTDAGRTVMVQPYLTGVDTAGETALVHLRGTYSHAIRKGALLTGPDTGVDGLYREEDISPREPSDAERAVAERVLDALPFDRADLLYVRVDLIPDAAGEPVLLEVELTEPSLFLAHDERAPARLADAIVGSM
jgi:glutathione synthase/RimK-type ligase-like ATP-grasp enzyme